MASEASLGPKTNLCFSPGMVKDSDSLHVYTHGDKCPLAGFKPPYSKQNWHSDAYTYVNLGIGVPIFT